MQIKMKSSGDPRCASALGMKIVNALNSPKNDGTSNRAGMLKISILGGTLRERSANHAGVLHKMPHLPVSSSTSLSQIRWTEAFDNWF